jgi:hypothetical protein
VIEDDGDDIAVMPKIEWLYDSEEERVEEEPHALSRDQWKAARQGIAKSESQKSSNTSGQKSLPQKTNSQKSLHSQKSMERNLVPQKSWTETSVKSSSNSSSKTQPQKELNDDQLQHSSSNEIQLQVPSPMYNSPEDEESQIEYAGVQDVSSNIGKRASLVHTSQPDTPASNETDAEKLAMAKTVLDNVAQALESATTPSQGSHAPQGIDGDISTLLQIFQESMGSFNVLLTKYEEEKEMKKMDRRRARSKKSNNSRTRI